MLHSEFIAVTTQPSALRRGDEETGTDPFAVVVIAVHRRHAPEIHVADLKGLAPGHGQGAICWVEVVVNASVHAQFTKTEIFVGGQLKEEVITGSRSAPVQRWLRVSREVVTGLVPNGQTVGGGGEANRGRRCSTAPFIGDGEGRSVAWVGCFCGVEDDAFSVGVRFVFSTNGHQHIKRCIIAVIEVVLDGLVQIKGEAVAALIAVSEGHGCRSVGAAAIVPLEAVGRHAVPSDFTLNPKSGLFHAMERNHGVARIGGTCQFHLGVDDG